MGTGFSVMKTSFSLWELTYPVRLTGSKPYRVWVCNVGWLKCFWIKSWGGNPQLQKLQCFSPIHCLKSLQCSDFTHFLKWKKYLLQFSHLQKELADQEPPSLLPKTFWDLLSSKLYPSGEFCPDCTTVSANRWLLYFPTVVLPKYLGRAQVFIASSIGIFFQDFWQRKAVDNWRYF